MWYTRMSYIYKYIRFACTYKTSVHNIIWQNPVDPHLVRTASVIDIINVDAVSRYCMLAAPCYTTRTSHIDIVSTI